MWVWSRSELLCRDTEGKVQCDLDVDTPRLCLPTVVICGGNVIYTMEVV